MPRHLMTMMRDRRLFAPADDPPPGGVIVDPAAPAPSLAPAPAPAPVAKPWYDDHTWSDPSLKEHLVGSGYHTGNAAEALEKALKGELAATQRLGKKPGELLDAPKADQSALDWLKTNGKAFGVPDAPDGYDVKLPDNLPAGMPLDEGMLADFKAHAHATGLPKAVVQDTVSFLAEKMGGKYTKIAADGALAETKLTTDLQNEWGTSYAVNQQQAVRAFQAIAAEMKLSPEAATGLAAKLNGDMGDATLMRFFHTLAGKMGEDVLAVPRHVNAPALQLAEAEQRKVTIMRSGTGEMAQARHNKARQAELQKELQGLNTIIAQYGAKG